MPIINIHLIEGRTVGQKRKLVKDVTKAVCEAVDAPASAVSIIIEEMSKENYATQGVLQADKK